MVILRSDPRFLAAEKALQAMHDFWKLQPCRGAVQWIEDSDGHLIVFSRGEYRHALRDAIGEGLVPDEFFELEGVDESLKGEA